MILRHCGIPEPVIVSDGDQAVMAACADEFDLIFMVRLLTLGPTCEPPLRCKSVYSRGVLSVNGVFSSSLALTSPSPRRTAACP